MSPSRYYRRATGVSTNKMHHWHHFLCAPNNTHKLTILICPNCVSQMPNAELPNFPWHILHSNSHPMAIPIHLVDCRPTLYYVTFKTQRTAGRPEVLPWSPGLDAPAHSQSIAQLHTCAGNEASGLGYRGINFCVLNNILYVNAIYLLRGNRQERRILKQMGTVEAGSKAEIPSTWWLYMCYNLGRETA